MTQTHGWVAYRANVGVSLETASLLVWTRPAVGIVEDPKYPADLTFHGVIDLANASAVIA